MIRWHNHLGCQFFLQPRSGPQCRVVCHSSSLPGNFRTSRVELQNLPKPTKNGKRCSGEFKENNETVRIPGAKFVGH